MSKKSSAGRRKKTKRAFEQDCTSNARDSGERKQESRLRLKITMLQRQVEQQEEFLRNFDVAEKKPEKKKKKGRSGPEDWILRGAARPYEMLQRIEAGELDQDGNEIHVPEFIDKFEPNEGKFWEDADTRKYVELLFELGKACIDAGKCSRGIRQFQKCMELDQTDAQHVRESLVSALLDEGRAGEARSLMDQYNGESSAVFAYSRVMTEYVAWKILDEEDASQAVTEEAFDAAFLANPYIPVFICGYEMFEQVVEYLDEIPTPPPSGSIEESFLYCSKNIGMWMDTEGVRDWLADQLSRFSEPEAQVANCANEMYLSMYHTAVEMMKDV